MQDTYKFLANLIDNIYDPVFVKDDQSRMILANDAFCKIFALPRNLILGKTLAENVPINEREHFLKIDNQVLSDGKVSLMEELLTIRNGATKTILTRKSRYTNNEGQHFLIGVIHDITAIKKMEAELIEAKERAEESDRLKSVFLANMSHEIRTPMNAILGFSQLLKKEKLDKEKKEKYFEFIDSAGKRLLRIISDIVDISRIDSNQLSLNYEPYDLNQLIDNLTHEFEIHHSNNGCKINTTKGLQDAESMTAIDVTRLTQILSNLLENSLKFTKKGVITFGYSKEKDKLEFFVKDTGIGISPKAQEIIFDRFIQVDNEQAKAGKGNGLGLSIAKSLVHLLKGELWVASEKGSGATFYFNIPYQPLAQAEKNKDNTVKKRMNNNHVTLLIAEDEFLNYKYLKALLGNLNYNVVHARNGKVAVDKVQNDTTINLVLMDINMPKMNGYEATAEIRKTNTTIPIIALTAYAMAEDRKKVLESGFNAYLTKPLSENELLKMIHTYV